MENFPALRFTDVIDDYRDHGDALQLFTDLYGVIRPLCANTETAVEHHLALLELLEQDAERHRD